MKYYIAKFVVPDEYKPKSFLCADNADGWFLNEKGALVSVPASLMNLEAKEATWEYLHTEEPEVFRCSNCGGFSGVDNKICSGCGAIMTNGS